MSGSGIKKRSESLCGAHESYLTLGGMFFCKDREAVTNGVNTGPGSFIHFNLFSDCSSSEDTCFRKIITSIKFQNLMIFISQRFFLNTLWIRDIHGSW